jgi:hypothetical protein
MNEENKSALAEREKELNERLAELGERERDLNTLRINLQLFGELIDDQAIYYKSLSKRLTFWRITSGILFTSLVTSLVIWTMGK